MKLYTYDPAPNPKRLDLFLKYKGIEIETQQIDLMSGEQLGEDFRAINPQLSVPALVLDDGIVLSEVIAICTYLEAMYPDMPLLGSTPLELALVVEWDHRLFNTAIVPIAEALRNGTPRMANRALPGPLDLAQIPDLVERGKKRVQFAWSQLDDELANKQWIAGDHFSFADIDLIVAAEFAGWVKSKPPESCGNLHAYLDRVHKELRRNSQE